MDQYRLEYMLIVLLAVVTCGSLITSICSAIAWNHWVDVMDKCPYSDWYRNHENCGCVLYGKKYDSGFRGGAISNCYYVTFAPLGTTLLLVFITGYHIVRIVINKKGKPNHNMFVERRDGEVVVTATPSIRNDDGGTHRQWIILSGLSVALAAYVLGYAVVLTDGYYKTCEQYRIDVSKEFSAFGNQQAVIYGRLSCSAIYDFMDYLFPNYNQYVRNTYINTAITLQIAMQTAWIGAILMFIVAFIYFRIARLNKI